MASCESSGFLVVGLLDGEEKITPTQLVATFITVSIASAWFNSKKIRRLGLFFAHWLS